MASRTQNNVWVLAVLTDSVSIQSSDKLDLSLAFLRRRSSVCIVARSCALHVRVKADLASTGQSWRTSGA